MAKHLGIACVFFAFAAVQLNDKDPILWVILYITTALIPILYIMNNKLQKLTYLIIGILCISTFTYMFDILQKIRNNWTDVYSGELWREFFGLFLAWSIFFIYTKKSHR